MKNVTPRRSPSPALKAIFFLIGFLYAAWETRVLWRELTSAIRKLRNR
jgi:hypothetical protein